ncbi:MAG: type II secretion system F family protein [Gammaproteobacteria bacterium]|nr:type II secretion system F family protein [Gammaproteobacteria bacterium]
MPIDSKNTGSQRADLNVSGLLASLEASFRRPRSLQVTDRMFFTEQLSLLLSTGVSLVPALEAMKSQSEDQSYVAMLESMCAAISEGKSFSFALSNHPELFPPSYVNLVAASENGGFMDKVLVQLYDIDEKQQQMRSTVMSAMSYPIFLVLFSLAVVAFVLVVVFPKFEDMFKAIADQLPLSTIVLMRASDILRHYWVFVIAAIFGILALIRYWMQTESGRLQLDRAKLSIPVLKDVFVKIYLSQFLRVMGTSLANGVGIVDTLNSCRGVVQNSVFQQFITRMQNGVQDGKGIGPEFSNSKFIPPVVRQMVKTGEETGSLPLVMARISDYYDRELSKQLKTLARLAEPLMLIVMGLVVGLLVSSLILPIFKLSRAVH